MIKSTILLYKLYFGVRVWFLWKINFIIITNDDGDDTAELELHI